MIARATEASFGSVTISIHQNHIIIFFCVGFNFSFMILIVRLLLELLSTSEVCTMSESLAHVLPAGLFIV